MCSSSKALCRKECFGVRRHISLRGASLGGKGDSKALRTKRLFMCMSRNLFVQRHKSIRSDLEKPCGKKLVNVVALCAEPLVDTAFCNSPPDKHFIAFACRATFLSIEPRVDAKKLARP